MPKNEDEDVPRQRPSRFQKITDDLPIVDTSKMKRGAKKNLFNDDEDVPPPPKS